MAISFLQAVVDTANASVYTFSSQNLGTAAADRYIVVALNSRMAGSPTSTSVTVGGVSATLVVEQWFSGCYSSLWIAAVPTGATGDIVATFGAGQVRAFYGAWRLDDLASATASDTDTSTAHPHAGTLDIPVDGVGIGSVIATDAVTMTWSGLTGDASGTGHEATAYAFAHQTYPSGSTGQAISATWTTGTKGSPSAVFAAFEFGAGGGPTTYYQTLSGLLTPDGSLARRIYKYPSGSLTATGDSFKKTSRLLQSSSTPSGSLTTQSVLRQLLAGSLTPSGALLKLTRRTVAGSLTAAATLSRVTRKGLSGAIATVGSLARKTSRRITGAITAAGSLATAAVTRQTLSGAITAVGSLIGAFLAFVAPANIVNRISHMRRFMGRR